MKVIRVHYPICEELAVTRVHWLFKEDPTLGDRRLCGVQPHRAPIVLRPVICGGRLLECVRCAKIGQELGIP